MEKFRKFAMMAVFAIIAMVLGACSSNDVNQLNDDTMYQYWWKAQYLGYNIQENNLGITPAKLADDVTQSMSSFNATLNEKGVQGVDEAALKKAIMSCKTSWQEKGWYSYIKHIRFQIGVFNFDTQKLVEYYTWDVGTEVDNKQDK